MEPLLILGERGEQNPYHFLFCIIPQFRAFDNSQNKIYYTYPYTHEQPFRDAGLRALPDRFQKQNDISGFQIFRAPNIPVAGVHEMDSWVFQYTRNLYRHLWQDRQPRKKIYISRQRASCRRVENEVNLLSGLEARGIQRVFLESISFEDSVRLFAEATLIVGPHGAGLSFSVFSAPGTFVLELNGPGSSQSHFSSLAAECNLKYKRYMDIQKIDNNYHVDPEHFFTELDEILAFIDPPPLSPPPEPPQSA